MEVFKANDVEQHVGDSNATESDSMLVKANVSAEKLLNYSVSRYAEQEGTLTRNNSLSIGLGVVGNIHQVERGYKLHDETLPSDCIASAAICSFCNNSNSRLQLY